MEDNIPSFGQIIDAPIILAVKGWRDIKDGQMPPKDLSLHESSIGGFGRITFVDLYYCMVNGWVKLP